MFRTSPASYSGLAINRNERNNSVISTYFFIYYYSLLMCIHHLLFIIYFSNTNSFFLVFICHLFFLIYSKSIYLSIISFFSLYFILPKGIAAIRVKEYIDLEEAVLLIEYQKVLKEQQALMLSQHKKGIYVMN